MLWALGSMVAEITKRQMVHTFGDHKGTLEAQWVLERPIGIFVCAHEGMVITINSL